MPDSLVIRRIRARPVSVPMKLPLHTASGAIDRAALVLLDLETAAGITGRAYLFAPSAAHLAPIVALVEAMSAMLAGDAVRPFGGRGHPPRPSDRCRRRGVLDRGAGPCR